MNNTKAYAAHSATDSLAPFSLQRGNVRAHDVQIDILYCGVCHSDIHQVRNEWGNSIYPMVPGHEIVGRVNKVGDQVTRLKLGITPASSSTHVANVHNASPVTSNIVK